MTSEHRSPAASGLIGADLGGEAIGHRGRAKDWDRHVRQADELSRTPGFRDLRDRIVAKAAPVAGERAVVRSACRPAEMGSLGSSWGSWQAVTPMRSPGREASVGEASQGRREVGLP
jgi:hypothetical protein